MSHNHGRGNRERPATALFQLLERAVERRDHAAAIRLQRQLREVGFSVCYIGRKEPDRRAGS